MTKGIVYILTNPCLDGWVKIGMTERDDIQKRLNELNAPANMPLSFQAYALYHVENPSKVEEHIHALIDAIDGSLHARETLSSGRIREREFFQITPERAFTIFKHVASLRGDFDQLEMVDLDVAAQEELEIATSRKPGFKFSMVNIPVGAKIFYLVDESIVCEVADLDNHILYNGKTYTMSGLVSELHGGGNFPGPKWFTYEGEVLADRRTRLEVANAPKD